MARRVMLHVGTPKTGTSAVQDVLFHHREHLKNLGILYPADRHDAQFLAALDLMQLPWGGLEEQATGRWNALAAEVRAWPETAIVSHEILGRASRAQAAQAVDSFGDTEVHVVISARDLARQIPAEWQENVKHRRTIRYRDFLDQITDESRTHDLAQWFWAVQEVPDILDRWAGGIPADRVHVITVPPTGADRGELWARFASTLGVDRSPTSPSERTNTSLGVAEAAMLRQLNTQLEGVLSNHYYRMLVREQLVHQFLANERQSASLSLPTDIHEWALAISRTWVSAISERGYQITGSLDDLLGTSPPSKFIDPDEMGNTELGEAAIRSLAQVITQQAAKAEELERVHADNADLIRQIDAAHSTRGYKLKEKLVGIAQQSYLGETALRAYRKLR